MAEPKSYRQLRKACWKGYQAIGVKQKNGRTVPNCVPESVLNPADPHKDYAEKSKTLQDLARNKDVDQKAVQQRRLDLNKEYSKHKLKEVLGPENDMGTPALTKKLLKLTPGQVVKEAKEKQEYDYEGDMARTRKMNRVLTWMPVTITDDEVDFRKIARLKWTMHDEEGVAYMVTWVHAAEASDVTQEGLERAPDPCRSHLGRFCDNGATRCTCHNLVEAADEQSAAGKVIGSARSP